MNSAKLLLDSGLKRTSARIEILDLLISVKRPITHQEISKSPGMEKMDKVTLYRALSSLRQGGLIHRIKGLDGIWRFCVHDPELGRCGGSHAHFMCFDCGQISCLLDQPLPWIAGPKGAKILGKQFLIYGQCALCVGKSKKQSSNKLKKSDELVLFSKKSMKKYNESALDSKKIIKSKLEAIEIK